MYNWPVFEELASAIDELDIAAEGASLTQVIALRDRLDARIMEATGSVRGQWLVGR